MKTGKEKGSKKKSKSFEQTINFQWKSHRLCALEVKASIQFSQNLKLIAKHIDPIF